MKSKLDYEIIGLADIEQELGYVRHILGYIKLGPDYVQPEHGYVKQEWVI